MRIHHISLFSSLLGRIVARTFPKTCLSFGSRAVQLTVGSVSHFMIAWRGLRTPASGDKAPIIGELDGGALQSWQCQDFRMN